MEAYLTEVLATKDPQTLDAYARILLDFARWLPRQAGRDQFHPVDMTRIALKTYFDAKKAEKKPLSRAEQEGKVTPLRGSERPLRYAPTTLSRMKVSLSSFAD